MISYSDVQCDVWILILLWYIRMQYVSLNPLVWNGQHLIFAASNTLDLFPKSLIENIWLPCRLYEYYPLRISLDYTLYKIRWKRYPAEKSANQSALELQPWKTAQFWFFRIGDILFIYVIILNTDMNFENGGWFFIF